jgi:hypothetical protein
VVGAEPVALPDMEAVCVGDTVPEGVWVACVVVAPVVEGVLLTVGVQVSVPVAVCGIEPLEEGVVDAVVVPETGAVLETVAAVLTVPVGEGETDEVSICVANGVFAAVPTADIDDDADGVIEPETVEDVVSVPLPVGIAVRVGVPDIVRAAVLVCVPD